MNRTQVDSGYALCNCGGSKRFSHDTEELHRLLKQERLAKEEVQDELERTSQKIKDMLSSMEGVEKGKILISYTLYILGSYILLAMYYIIATCIDCYRIQPAMRQPRGVREPIATLDSVQHQTAGHPDTV